MKKFNYVIVSLLVLSILLSVILLLSVKAILFEINNDFDIIHKQIENNKNNTDLRIDKILVLVEQNQQNTEEIITRLDLQLSARINELSRDADIKNRNLGITLEEIRKSRLSEADRLNNLIGSYIEETMKDDTSGEMSEINDRLVSIYKEIEENKENTNQKNIELQRTIALNQKNTEKIISGLELKLNAIFAELNKYADNRSSSSEDLLSALNKAVESDYQKQQLLNKGSLEYENENFTEAIKVYKKILNIDSTNTKAQCYYNASLYYQNPGDGSNFPGIKNDLIPLLEGNGLTNDEKRTALNVLIGISREEGRVDSLQKYQDALHILEDNRK